MSTKNLEGQCMYQWREERRWKEIEISRGEFNQKRLVEYVYVQYRKKIRLSNREVLEKKSVKFLKLLMMGEEVYPLLSVCLSVLLFLFLSVYLSMYLSIYISIYLSIYLFNYLSIYPAIYLSIYLFFFQPSSVSIHPFTRIYIFIPININIGKQNLKTNTCVPDQRD